MKEQTKELIAKQQAGGIYPGVVYQLRKGQQVETVTLGQAAIIPDREIMTADKLFDVASLTKVVCTTTVLLKLWQQGEIDFDAPLQKYLPSFKDSRITLRHLLTHTSDIVTWIPNRDQLTAAELRQAYLSLQAGAKIGQVVKYTDAGTILLGFMLESLYGEKVIDVFQKEVLTPLGMKESYFMPEEKLLPQIVPTEQLASGTVLRGITHDPKARVLGTHAGNAGLFTDVTDLSKFASMYLHEGVVSGRQFLQPETIQMLLQDQTLNLQGGRSLGWDLRYNRKRQPLLYHTGYTGTFILINPQTQESFIFLSNRLHPKDDNPTYLKARDQLVASYLNEV